MHENNIRRNNHKREDLIGQEKSGNFIVVSRHMNERFPEIERDILMFLHFTRFQRLPVTLRLIRELH